MSMNDKIVDRNFYNPVKVKSQERAKKSDELFLKSILSKKHFDDNDMEHLVFFGF